MGLGVPYCALNMACCEVYSEHGESSGADMEEHALDGVWGVPSCALNMACCAVYQERGEGGGADLEEQALDEVRDARCVELRLL